MIFNCVKTNIFRTLLQRSKQNYKLISNQYNWDNKKWWDLIKNYCNLRCRKHLYSTSLFSIRLVDKRSRRYNDQMEQLFSGHSIGKRWEAREHEGFLLFRNKTKRIRRTHAHLLSAPVIDCFVHLSLLTPVLRILLISCSFSSFQRFIPLIMFSARPL